MTLCQLAARVRRRAARAGARQRGRVVRRTVIAEWGWDNCRLIAIEYANPEAPCRFVKTRMNPLIQMRP